MKKRISDIVVIIFIFALFFHLAEAVYFKYTRKPLIDIKHARVGFPFTDDFYFHRTQVTGIFQGTRTPIDFVSLIQQKKLFFVSRAYWNLYSRFNRLPESQFNLLAEQTCRHFRYHDDASFEAIEFESREQGDLKSLRRYNCE